MKIRLCGLCKQFGSAIILDNVEAELESGQLVALAGTNGAGKFFADENAGDAASTRDCISF